MNPDNVTTQTRLPLILIIEDSPADLRLLSELIKDKGEIIFAVSGRDGLAQIQKRQPDLILLDVELPDINGYELCQAIKHYEQCNHIPIIFVTGHRTADHEISGLEAGAVDFISKPFNPPIVRARIDTHLTLKIQTDALHRLSQLDGLTGIYNRRHFDSQGQKEWYRHQRLAQPLAIFLLDIDHFKLYNDHYGHIAGDRCIKQVAQSLHQRMRRAGEFVARYGGEEFVCLLPHSNLNDAVRFAPTICENVQQLNIPHEHSKSAQHVTVSLGVSACVPTKGMTFQELITKADQALYQAKAAGRNQVCFISYE